MGLCAERGRLRGFLWSTPEGKPVEKYAESIVNLDMSVASDLVAIAQNLLTGAVNVTKSVVAHQIGFLDIF